MKWWFVGSIILFGILFWIYRQSALPIPGTFYQDLGREHVSNDVVMATKYSSNPPTSGPHLVTWVKPGMYEEPQLDGELIHSLEHGYVVISYNCGVHLGSNSKFNIQSLTKSFLEKVHAHEDDTEATGDGKFIPKEATGSARTDTQDCKKLLQQLSDLVNRKKLFKLILVPRPTLETTIALAAWNYLDAFDSTAGDIDVKRIEQFIDYHRDHGPEDTME